MYIEITLDKPRKLRYKAAEVMALEKELGQAGHGNSLLRLFEDNTFKDHVGISLIVILLWGGLRWEDKGLTLQRVSTLLDDYLEKDGDIQVLLTEIMKAIAKSNILGKSLSQAMYEALTEADTEESGEEGNAVAEE